MSHRTTSALLVAPLAAMLGLSYAVAAQETEEKEEKTPERAEIELEEKNDTNVTGRAIITKTGGEAKPHAHEVVLQIDVGQETPTGNFPAHIHRGTCEDTGPVVAELEALQPAGGGATATAGSRTQLTREDFAMEAHERHHEGMAAKEKAEGEAGEYGEAGAKEKAEGEAGEYGEAGAEEKAAKKAEEKEAAHAYLIQVHLPDGTPAACGELPMMKAHGMKEGEKKPY